MTALDLSSNDGSATMEACRKRHEGCCLLAEVVSAAAGPLFRRRLA